MIQILKYSYKKITATKTKNNYINDINTRLGNILHTFVIILCVFPKSILYNKIITITKIYLNSIIMNVFGTEVVVITGYKLNNNCEIYSIIRK